MANTLNLGDGNWATKKDSLLAYNSENNNYKPLPFDFSRGSSATRVNKDGLIETVGSGKARIDFKDDSKGALLLEPQRKNEFTNSEDFSTNWSNSNVEINANQITSLNGTINADFIRENQGSNPHFIFQEVGATTTSEYTLSVFAKYHSRFLQMFFGGGDVSGNPYVNFDLQNGTFNNIGANSVSMENYGNGWYKCSVTATSSVTSGFNPIFGLVKSIGASRANSYTGDGTSGVYLWGAMLEQGSYATSYITTQGSAVTRLADSCSQTAPDGVIGQTEGTVYTEINISNTTTKTILALDIGSASNFIILDTSSSLSPEIKVRQSSGSFPSIITGTTMNYGVNKIAFCYKSGDYAMYVNGVLSGTSTSATFPSGIISQISLGANPNYGYLSDTVSDLKLYNTRLSNSELQALTSN